MRQTIGLLLCLACIPALAQVYKWVDENGVVHYTDQPPAKNAKPADLPPLQEYKGGTLPKLEDYAKEEKKPAPEPVEVSITSPTQDQTFRGDSEGRVTVSVALKPGLRDGNRLIYFLDGVQQGGPTAERSKTIGGIERGEHSVQVAVVDEAGNELSRSKSVTLHMKLPIARN